MLSKKRFARVQLGGQVLNTELSHRRYPDEQFHSMYPVNSIRKEMSQRSFHTNNFPIMTTQHIPIFYKPSSRIPQVKITTSPKDDPRSQSMMTMGSQVLHQTSPNKNSPNQTQEMKRASSINYINNGLYISPSNLNLLQYGT